jgi:hypothetical protein
MKKFCFVCIILLTCSTIHAQGGVPKRNVLYTLGKNEILKYNEYYTYQTASKNGFSCIVVDTLQPKETFIFNGNPIYSNEWIGNGIIDIDLTKENGYIFSFVQNDELYVNVRGKVEGPFEEVLDYMYYFDYILPEKYNFFYQLGGRWYAYYEGKAQVLEKKNNVIERGYCGGYVMSTENGKRYFSEFCNKSYRNKVGFDELISQAMSGDYVAYICLNNGKRYFCINDVLSEPFDNSGNNNLDINGDKYIYSFQRNGKTVVNVNGKLIEVDCENIAYTTVLKSGVFYFSYSKNGKEYINVNGKIFGPYDEIFDYKILDNGKFALVYRQGDMYYFINNGVVSKGYNLISSLVYNADGTYKFNFSGKDGWVYENINGQIQKTQDRKFGFGKGYFEPSVEKYEIRSKANMNTMFLDIAYDYVVIDGKSYGKAPAIKAWYDEAKNSFVWNAWEGKELVLYEFPLQ